MKQRRDSIRRFAWLALFGFVWVQFGLLAHLSLVRHDIDAHGHSVHSSLLALQAQRSLAHSGIEQPRNQQPWSPKKVPLSSSEDCQVMHFIEHSAGLLFASTSLLATQLLRSSSCASSNFAHLRFERQRYLLSPAQSPPPVPLV